MEETNDANTTPDSSSGETITQEVVLEPEKTEGGLISTTDFVEKSKDTDISEDAEQNTSKTDTEEKKNFDEHPRFKELIKEKNELKKQLEEASHNDYMNEINSLKQQLAQIQQPAQQQQQLPDLNSEEFLDMFAENPAQVFNTFGEQIRNEAIQTVFNQLQESQYEQSVKSLEAQQLDTFNKFFEDNPDAQAKWDSGEISEYMSKHPGHNAISAFNMISNDSRIKEATEKAVKEALEQQQQQLKAAGKASAFSSNPITPQVEKKSETGGDKLSQMLARWRAREA